MSKKVILITGANGDLGIAMARSFLADSDEAVVYLGVRRGREEAKAVVEEFPERSAVVDLDVGKVASWKGAVEEILTAEACLDVLVNNAGLHKDALLGTMALEAWSEVMRANLDGVFHGCQAVIKQMMHQKFGRIINISSLSALLAPRGQTNYAAAKAGVVALTQSLAKEVARSRITVNALCPGYIQTAALDGMSEEERKEKKRNIPMRRFGKPEEVAAAVRFLASEEASYVTGATLKIDGGIF